MGRKRKPPILPKETILTEETFALQIDYAERLMASNLISEEEFKLYWLIEEITHFANVLKQTDSQVYIDLKNGFRNYVFRKNKRMKNVIQEGREEWNANEWYQEALVNKNK
jgi:hypothetical protein